MDGPGIRTDDDGRIVGYRLRRPAPSLPTYQEAADISAFECRVCATIRSSYPVTQSIVEDLERLSAWYQGLVDDTMARAKRNMAKES